MVGKYQTSTYLLPAQAMPSNLETGFRTIYSSNIASHMVLQAMPRLESVQQQAGRGLFVVRGVASLVWHAFGHPTWSGTSVGTGRLGR